MHSYGKPLFARRKFRKTALLAEQITFVLRGTTVLDKGHGSWPQLVVHTYLILGFYHSKSRDELVSSSPQRSEWTLGGLSITVHSSAGRNEKFLTCLCLTCGRQGLKGHWKRISELSWLPAQFALSMKQDQRLTHLFLSQFTKLSSVPLWETT